MGTGYKGNTTHHRSISDNMPIATSKFQFHNGYFGIQGDGRKGYSRHIISKDPIKAAEELYKILAKGGIESSMPNGKGVFTKMKDGTIISYREIYSSDGTPVVEINIKDSSNNGCVNQQKIHFIKKEEQ